MKRSLLGLAHNRLTFLAVALATSVCLATAVGARGSEGGTAIAQAGASTGAESFCAELRKEIGSRSVRFSGWRCKPGPNIRGHETVLAWVKLTDLGGRANLELIWLAKLRPVTDAPVIDAVIVPRYGYEPSNVRRAFRSAGACSGGAGIACARVPPLDI